VFAIEGSGAFYKLQIYKAEFEFRTSKDLYSSLVLAQAFEVGEGWRENNQQ
jgi:hypothetical protein